MRFQRNPRNRPFQRRGADDTTHVLAAIRSSIAATPTSEPVVEQSVETKHQFTDFAISQALLENIRAKGYTQPTPIQDEAIPAILDNRDVIGIANTGTGKTAAFLIPLIEKISQDKNKRVLIITPTRELALQIGTEMREFSRGLGVRWAMIIGGTSVWRQQQDLKNNPHVVIGTPGRIKDLIQQRQLSMSQFRHVVLDEADRMVDIGFIGDMKFFISLLPQARQSLFFSATVSGKVAEILNQFVSNPITVSVKKQNTTPNVSQHIIEIKNGKKKIEYLHELLIQKEFEKVLIFGKTKWGVERLASDLTSRGFKAGSIHGNKRQSQRQRILTQFKLDEINILLATDIASRGLDIDNVSHVINYDIPTSYEDYVHRIGRTGRANKLGAAVTFVG